MDKKLDKNFSKSLDQMIVQMLEGGIPAAAASGVSEEEQEALYSLAFNYYQQNKLEKAKSLFGFLCLQNCLVPKYWQGLAACCKMLKEYENAIKAYGVLTLYEEDITEPTLEVIECYIALNLLMAAKDILEELLKIDPKALSQEGLVGQRIKAIAALLAAKESKIHGK